MNTETMHEELVSPTPLTQKGREKRQRIIDAAADLIFERGVAEVSLDDIRDATGVSKSQLYHYFDDKSDLLHAVIECQRERVLGIHRPTFRSLEVWDDLLQWRDMIVAHQAARSCRSGCPLGSLANGLAELDEVARYQLSEAFSSWGGIIADGLTRMVETGDLSADANPKELAVSVLASLQGGLLMAETARDTRPLEIALDAALAHVRSFTNVQTRTVAG
jgi:TetR/AcrR family transcriptional regulator, transcriptional repressor for nem operon